LARDVNEVVGSGLAWTRETIGAARRRLRAIVSRRFSAQSLSTKLLALTVLFVMLAEVVIFVPSIANFRTAWLGDRLTAARLAALAADATPHGDVPTMVRDELLMTMQVKAVALKRDIRKEILREEGEITIDATYDLRAISSSNVLVAFMTRAGLIFDAVMVFLQSDQRTIRVVGAPGNMAEGHYVEVVLPQGPLRAAMIRHALNILGLSVVISVVAGGLLFLTLRSVLIEPLMRLTDNMLRFSAKPEDASRIIVPSQRLDEIGTAERELAHMQSELNQILGQKSRLAALGLAVSKINHDLRNMLASAQLLSDNLTSVPDPRVQRFAPKLIASLDRAIAFCNDTLKFGKVAEATPRRDLFVLRPLVEEVADGLGLTSAGPVSIQIDVAGMLRVDADRDQLYRVLANLTRNAMQAIEAQGAPGVITVRAERGARRVTIDVADDGPGLPQKARAHLFEAFQGSTRRGGSGLGLAIAYELVTAHGGSIDLVETAEGARGMIFRLVIPDRSTAAET
jgi:signal transduction histidine kinase